MPTTSSGETPITIKPGYNDPPIRWQFLNNSIPDSQEPGTDDIFDLDLSTIYLTIARPGSSPIIQKNTLDNTELEVDVENGILTWTPTVAETRLFTLSSAYRYEVERRVGSFQGQLATGLVIVSTGSVNTD